MDVDPEMKKKLKNLEGVQWYTMVSKNYFKIIFDLKKKIEI